MKTLVMGAALALGACSSAGGQEAQGSGETGQRSFEVGAFEAIRLAGSHDVVVRVGGAPSVSAQGDMKALDRLEVEVKDGVLNIGSRRRGLTDWGDHGSVSFAVTVPSLRAADLAGSGDLEVDRAEAETFEASIAGSGDLSIGALRARRADFKIAGSGNIRAAGAVDQAEVSIAGSGNAALEKVASRRADVSIAGSGNVRLQASEAVSGSIMGSGDIIVAGGARCSVRKMGSGELRCS